MCGGECDAKVWLKRATCVWLKRARLVAQQTPRSWQARARVAKSEGEKLGKGYE